jgi:autotransporter-associated beta strand protein
MAVWAPPGTADSFDFGQSVEIVDPATGSTINAGTVSLTNAPVMVVGVPSSLVAQAQSNRVRPFPWRGNYTAAQAVFATMSGPNAEHGLHQLNADGTSTAVTVYGGPARDCSQSAAQYFTVDPNFLFPAKYYRYKIEYSTDNAAWSTFADRTATSAVGNPCYTDAGRGFGRYVRITVTGTQSSSDWASIWELQVHGFPRAMAWNAPAHGNWASDNWTGFPPSYPDGTVDVVVDTPYVVTVDSPQQALPLGISGGARIAIASGSHLAVTGNVTVGSGSDLLVQAGGTLALAGLDAGTGAGSVGLDGGILQASRAFATAVPLAIGPGGGTLNTNGFDVTLNAAVGGTGGLLKIGAGTLTLAADNPSLGDTTVASGTLVVQRVDALPVGARLTIDAGGTVVLAGGLNRARAAASLAASAGERAPSLTVGPSLPSPGLAVGRGSPPTIALKALRGPPGDGTPPLAPPPTLLLLLVQPLIEIDWRHRIDAGAGQGGNGGGEVVEAEHQHGTGAQARGEGIHVGHVDLGFLEDPEQFEHAARFVAHLDGHHVGHRHRIARRGQFLERVLPVLDDQAQRAGLSRFGQGERNEVDAGVGQRLAGRDEASRFVVHHE